MVFACDVLAVELRYNNLKWRRTWCQLGSPNVIRFKCFVCRSEEDPK
jgi:hypothetical protein